MVGAYALFNTPVIHPARIASKITLVATTLYKTPIKAAYSFPVAAAYCGPKKI